VFLDLVMPEKDGRAILKSLAPEVREAIRWIFITANRHKIKELRDVGVAYGILEKPFSLVKFERTVKELFKDLEIKI
jgi:CheY-like chemotaxis protein